METPEDFKALFNELDALLDLVEPKMQKMQAHTVVGEKPPNSLMAEIAADYVTALGRIVVLNPEDKSLTDMVALMTRMHKAYVDNNDIEIAIANAELMGSSFSNMRTMVSGMKEMFDMMTGGGQNEDGGIILPPDFE